MKQLFDVTVSLENLGAAIAAYAMVWLHGRYHWMTGPQAQITIHRAMLLMVICSVLALILGCSSMIIFRVMKSRIAKEFGARKTWGLLSVLASVVLLLLSLLPIQTG
jgi:hypothetical protein